MATSGDEKRRVLVWPPWVGNPYVPRLMTAMRKQGLDVRLARSLRLGALRLDRGDWVHLHWPGGPLIHRWRWLYELRGRSMAATLKWLRGRGLRIAWTAHNLLPHDDPHPDLARACRAELLRSVDHVFIHFPGAAAELRDAFGYAGPTTITHHPHYVDEHPTPPTRAEARRQLGLPEHGLVALGFGLLRPYKGIADVIRAFLKVAGDDDRLVLAGRPYPGVDEELALARSDPRVIVHARRIFARNVPRYFAAADASVIAYREFFTSGSALLSLSMGCPIVGPPVHHLADLAGDGRVIPTQLGPDGIAAGLQEARRLAPLADRAEIRAWALAHGTWDTAAAAIAGVMRAP